MRIKGIVPNSSTVYILAPLYVKSKEERRRRIMGFGQKIPFFESGGIFDKEKSVTVEKTRILTGNICNCQERKGFNVKRPKPSRNKVR